MSKINLSWIIIIILGLLGIYLSAIYFVDALSLSNSSLIVVNRNSRISLMNPEAHMFRDFFLAIFTYAIASAVFFISLVVLSIIAMFKCRKIKSSRVLFVVYAVFAVIYLGISVFAIVIDNWFYDFTEYTREFIIVHGYSQIFNIIWLLISVAMFAIMLTTLFLGMKRYNFETR